MNNFIIGLKRFLKNKNVVTVLLVIAAIVALYIGYTSSIRSQTNPVSIPVAAQVLPSEHQITSEDVRYTTVASSMVSEGVIRNAGAIIGKYTNINVTIPEGSMFYNDWLAEPDEIPGNWIEQLDYKAGELGFYMDVDISSTLGNSVLPRSYVDIYMKATDENGTVMFGKLLKNVKILVVHDGNGQNVFNNSAEIGSPAKIGFAVKQDMYILLKKAEYLNLELVIAPRGYTVPTEDYVIVTSATLRDYIDAQTITVEEDAITQPNPNPNQAQQ